MNHVTRDELTAFDQLQLTAREAAEVYAHLQACSECYALYESISLNQDAPGS